MEKIVGQMKVNKEQVQKQVQQLRQRIDQLINEITVNFRRIKKKRYFVMKSFLEYIYEFNSN